MAMFPRDKLVDHVGAYRTQSLFLETNSSSLPALMTLKEVDWEYKGEVYPSLKKIYMELEDPTEYAVAEAVFGSWPQWLRLLDNKAVRKYIDEWREELEIKIRSKGIRSLVNTAALKDGKGTTAAKYLAERGWDKRRAGAPSKAEKAGHLKREKALADEVKDDLARIGIH